MASNGRLGLRSGSPSFLVIGLSLVIVVLLYSYWSVSSRNNMLLRDQSLLQERLRTLTSQKIKVEHKYSAARSQTTDLERAKRKLEEKDVTSSNHKSRLDSKIKELESEIRVEKQKFLKTKSEGVKSKSELFKLKSEIDTTHEKFKTMNSKADSLMVMHKKLQDTVKAQSHELLQTKNDREVLRVQLEQAKVESHHIQPKPNLQKPAGPLGAQRKQVPGQQNVAAKQALDVKTSNSSEATPTLSSVVVADKHKIAQQPSEKPTAVSTMEKTKRGKPIEEGEVPNARQVRFDKKTRFGQQEE